MLARPVILGQLNHTAGLGSIAPSDTDAAKCQSKMIMPNSRTWLQNRGVIEIKITSPMCLSSPKHDTDRHGRISQRPTDADWELAHPPHLEQSTGQRRLRYY